MDINFKKQVNGLDGKPLAGDGNAMHTILANLLAYSSSGPMVKFMDWARSLVKGDKITIDRTDSEVLSAFIKESNLPNITKDQMVNTIEAARVKEVRL